MGAYIFSDKSNIDLPMQNYTYIPRDIPPRLFGEIVSRCEKNRNKKSSFFKVVFDPYQPYPGDIPQLQNYTFKKTMMLIFDLRKLKENKSLISNNISTKIAPKEYLEFEKGLLSDKTESQIKKWYKISKKSRELNLLTYRKNGYIQGRSDLYLYKNIAKIEDLEVNIKSQGQGVGRALISHSIYLAYQNNKNFIYLLCDSELGEYYLNCGFTLYSEFNTFIKYY